MRLSSRLVTGIGVAALAVTGSLLAGPAGAVPQPAATGGPGQYGTILTLGNGLDLTGGYDVADNAKGTAYIGWIAPTSAGGATRTVYLCTLPAGASTCSGGVQSTASLGGSSAAGLRVLLTKNGTVDLVWFHDTDQSINGPQNAAIALATAPGGKNLGAATDIGSAPSFGYLLDAALDPSGAIWTVAYASDLPKNIQVRDGSASYDTVNTPWPVGTATIGFAGTQPVVVAGKNAAITTPPDAWTTLKNGKWSAFASIPKTGPRANPSLAATGSGLRLIAMAGDASYRTVTTKWTGNGFAPRALTSDTNNCTPASHDANSDASGRLVDVTWECNQLTVVNYPDGHTASISRMNVRGTTTYTPQIASGSRGSATVVYSVESKTSGSALRVTHWRLGDADRSVTHRGTGGKVKVTGPVSCLPAVTVPIGVHGIAAAGWKPRSSTLELGTKKVSGFLDGATLKAGNTYTLTGTATFAKGRKHGSATAKLTFRTCP